MKMKDISNKTPAELQKLVAEKRQALSAFRFGTAAAKSKNVKEGREVKKDIARIMTALNKN